VRLWFSPRVAGVLLLSLGLTYFKGLVEKCLLAVAVRIVSVFVSM